MKCSTLVAFCHQTCLLLIRHKSYLLLAKLFAKWFLAFRRYDVPNLQRSRWQLFFYLMYFLSIMSNVSIFMIMYSVHSVHSVHSNIFLNPSLLSIKKHVFLPITYTYPLCPYCPLCPFYQPKNISLDPSLAVNSKSSLLVLLLLSMARNPSSCSSLALTEKDTN